MVPMEKADLSAAFNDFAWDLIDSAESAEELELLASLATLAWNIAVQPREDHEEMIATFIDRFDCEQIPLHGTMLDTRQKVLEMAGRKHETYPDANVIIRQLDMEDRPDGLRVEIARFDRLD